MGQTESARTLVDSDTYQRFYGAAVSRWGHSNVHVDGSNSFMIDLTSLSDDANATASELRENGCNVTRKTDRRFADGTNPDILIAHLTADSEPPRR